MISLPALLHAVSKFTVQNRTSRYQMGVAVGHLLLCIIGVLSHGMDVEHARMPFAAVFACTWKLLACPAPHIDV